MQLFRPLFIVVFLFNSFVVTAQSCCDSTVTYLCKGFDDAYDSSRTEYTYSSTGQILFKRTYVWNAYGGGADSIWYLNSSTNYQYNANGQITDIMSGGQHTYYVYDASGHLLNQTDSSSYSASKNFYTYDVSGNVTEHISQSLNSGTWINQQRETFLYNSSGHDSVQANYTWSGGWQLQNQTERYYYLSGSDSTKIISVWNGTSLNPSSRSDFFHNAVPFDTLRINFQFNNTSLHWDTTSKQTFEYDTAGNITFRLTETYSNSSWRNSEMAYYDYDSHGVESGHNIYYDFGEGWEIIFWSNSTYNSFGNITSYYSSCSGCGSNDQSYQYDAYQLLSTYSHSNYSHGGVGGGEDCHVYFYKIYGDTAFCSGDSVMLFVKSGTSYHWSNGQTNDTIYVSNGGYYSCLITDSSGRNLFTANIYVSESNGVSASPDSNITKYSCSNDYLELSQDYLPGNTYQWLRNDSVITSFNPLNTVYQSSGLNWIAGNYRCVVMNACGIDTSAIIHVVRVSPPVASITNVGSTTFCQGDSVLLIGNPGPYSYKWYPYNTTNDTLVVGPNRNSGNYYFYLTVTDSNGCHSNDSRNVTINFQPGPPSVRIINNQLTTTYSPSLWLLDGVQIANATSVTAADTGIYTVVNYNGSCTSSTSFYFAPGQLSANAAVNASAQICFGSTITLGMQNNTATGGQPPYHYSWSPSTGLSSTSIATPDASPIQSTEYFLQVTDNLGNTSTDSVYIKVNPLPSQPEIDTVATSFCFNDRYNNQLRSESDSCGYFTISWYETSSLYSIYDYCYFTAIQSGNYYVVKRDQNGCTSMSDTVHLNVWAYYPNLPTPTSTGLAVACGGQGTYLHYPQQAYPIQWYLNNNPVGNVGDTLLPSHGSGNYRIEFTDPHGCTTSSSIIYVQDSVLQVNISQSVSTPVCEGDSVLLIASTSDSAATFQWYRSFSVLGGFTNDSIYVKSSGDYYCTVAGMCNGTSYYVYADFVPHPSVSAVQQGSLLVASTHDELMGWYKNDTLISINPSAVINGEGVYRCRAYNEYCSDTAEWSITISCTISCAVDSMINPTCAGCDNGIIYFNCGNDTSAYDINISPGAGDIHAGYIDHLPAGSYFVYGLDSLNCILGDSVTLTDPPNGISGVKEMQISIYPVPAHEAIHIDLSVSDEIKQLELYDVNGKKLLLMVVTNKISLDLDVRKYVSGIYTFRFLSDDGYYLKKWIKAE